VLNTVRDTLLEGFSVVLLVDTVRAANVLPDDGERALAQMYALGATAGDLAEVHG